ncbi:MAG TPA: hypothetical protein VFE14_09695 [Micromonosporaceae bacterium]|nr:hypothetical protein [Micromonosporaceae bacterium]
MNRTTPPPVRDVAALFPGIERFAATATRLHPRRGTPDPFGSHVGGPLLWPAGEPWPACDAEHVVPAEIPVPPELLARLKAASQARDWPGWEAVIAKLASEIPGFGGVDRRTGSALGHTAGPPPRPSPLVAVAQLRVADVPDLHPPVDADLLQVLWCPNDHDLDGAAWAPAVTVRWWRQEDVSAAQAPPAPAVVSQRAYLPRPCVLHPERVVEYPWWQELPTGLGHRVRAWDNEHDGLYHRRLSMAPGWKVGGWPPWPTTDPRPMYCGSCGSRMDHLLQVDSGEWGDRDRWCPLEERALGSGTAAYLAATEPTGIVAGRSGLYRIFSCPYCPDAPVRVDPQ